MAFNNNPIRRSQLITSQGVGAVYVIKGGLSVMACGLDHWFEREDGNARDLRIEEFQVNEYRLERLLKVSGFRLPPDFRSFGSENPAPNGGLSVPFVRFPLWHVCSKCRRLERLRLTDRDLRRKCRECKDRGNIGYLQQVLFLAVCEEGHIQDFPWRDWAHRSANTSCERTLRYQSSGAGLIAQSVKCDCGESRTLAGITYANADGSTTLSLDLDASKEIYLCRGHRPWLGDVTDSPCSRHLRGAMSAASNVWFGRTYSSIFLPEGTAQAPSELIELLRSPRVESLSSALPGVQSILPLLRTPAFSRDFADFTDEQIVSAFNVIYQSSSGGENTSVDDDATAFRRAEFNVLSKDSDDPLLQISSWDVSTYEPEIGRYFSRIGLVNKLRETRVFGGFSRIFAGRDLPIERRKELLWKVLPKVEDQWLPASLVFGEGIFLELNEEVVCKWESAYKVSSGQQINTLQDNYEAVRQKIGLQARSLTPRFVMLHTLAHLLINRLTFECGYATASLRERLYVSDDSSAPMAGILIYTAAGDSEGTMGGLVRTGKPGYFESLFRRAVEGAEWCSSDPVCRELGSSRGQGPDSCNLAACHACALLPETSCEEFNRFLDRSMIIDGPGEGRRAIFQM